MKVFLFAFVALFAIVAAKSVNDVDEREKIVTRTVLNAVENFKQHLQDAGYDPYTFNFATEHRLPQSDLLVMTASIENFLVVGLSDIVVDNLSYNFITARINYEVRLPSVSVSLAGSSFYTKTFGHVTDSSLSGRVSFLNSIIKGEAQLDGSIFDGEFSVLSISASYSLGGVESNLRGVLFGDDLTDKLNSFFVNTFPGMVRDSQTDVDIYSEYLAWKVVDWLS